LCLVFCPCPRQGVNDDVQDLPLEGVGGEVIIPEKKWEKREEKTDFFMSFFFDLITGYVNGCE
jgi:hypothetical protein